jgi:hypothetical protein
MNVVWRPVGERAAGRRPSRTRALFTAAVVGAGTAVITYRILRSAVPRDQV